MMTGSGGGGNNKWTDEQEWERKKAHQRAMMARGKGPDAKGLGNGALGVSGIGSYAQKQASQGIAEKPTYPSPADLPKYNSLAEKQQAQRDAFANIQKPGFGMGYSVKPNVPRKPIDDMRSQGIAKPNTNTAPTPIDDIQPTYQESDNAGGISKGDGGGKRPGLSIDNNAAIAKPLAPAMGGENGDFGFRVMPPPRKAYGEDSRRQALAMDIKPYKNGMGLTTGQVALKNSILNGDDEKYANEQYQGQLSAAQKMAQEGMQQAGANSRAELSERGANTRASQRLGFDSDKFQQVAALDKRKLDMQQDNNNVSNYAPKQVMQLYEQRKLAETPEQVSEIDAQIQLLSGGSKGGSKPIVINHTGQTATGDQMGTTVDNPAILYDPDSKEFINLPTAERTPNDPPMLAIQQSGKFTKEQKGEIYDIYMAGGDISGYLE